MKFKIKVFFASLAVLSCAQLVLHIVLRLTTDEYGLRLRRNPRQFWIYYSEYASTMLETTVIKPVKVNNINCRALFDGDINAVRKAEKQEHWVKQSQLEQERDLIFRTSSCRNYIRNEGYVMDGLTEAESDFPLAFSIIMYRDVLQVELLLKVIYRPQNLYCIHVDLRSESIYKSMEHVANCFPNVFLSTRRLRVSWGEMPVLEAELICMRELLERSKKWKYFINLTGQEFPLKTNAEIVAILTAFKGANNVAGTHSMTMHIDHRFDDRGPPPHGLEPAKGSVHIAVNRKFVEFALFDRRAKDLLSWLNGTAIPDETFFITLNLSPSLNIPGSYKYDDFQKLQDSAIMRYKIFSKDDDMCRGGKRVRDICILGIDYLPKLVDAVQLFANKFEWNHDRVSLYCIQELLVNRTIDEYHGVTKFDPSWYATLDFVLNKL